VAELAQVPTNIRGQICGKLADLSSV